MAKFVDKIKDFIAGPYDDEYEDDYDEYEDACEHHGVIPKSEEDIKEEVLYGAGIRHELQVGGSITINTWNDDVKEYYDLKKTEDDQYEIRFILFVT